ncbi:MAG: YaaL family protein [Firmicutes bacterium]|nr:YaaL family protein [Bacillota bacterium]
MADLSSNDPDDERLLADIEQAQLAWEVATEQFNHACDADVIDDAIYLLTAAELRYEGLLRIARRRNLRVAVSGVAATRVPQDERAGTREQRHGAELSL